MMQSRDSIGVAKKREFRPYMMNNTPDHQQLCQWIAAIATSRDKQAFTCLFKFFAGKIRQISVSKFPNPDQANEVVQETMTNVWRKAHLFQADKGAPTTWVFTIMRNVTFDMLRKVQSNKEDNLSDDIWPTVDQQLIVDDDEFKDHIEDNIMLQHLNGLPESQQQIVRGIYFQEMTHEALAQHLNIPVGTVKSRLRLAIAKLKSQMGADHD